MNLGGLIELWFNGLKVFSIINYIVGLLSLTLGLGIFFRPEVRDWIKRKTTSQLIAYVLGLFTVLGIILSIITLIVFRPSKLNKEITTLVPLVKEIHKELGYSEIDFESGQAGFMVRFIDPQKAYVSVKGGTVQETPVIVIVSTLEQITTADVLSQIKELYADSFSGNIFVLGITQTHVFSGRAFIPLKTDVLGASQPQIQLKFTAFERILSKDIKEQLLNKGSITYKDVDDLLNSSEIEELLVSKVNTYIKKLVGTTLLLGVLNGVFYLLLWGAYWIILNYLKDFLKFSGLYLREQTLGLMFIAYSILAFIGRAGLLWVFTLPLFIIILPKFRKNKI